MALTSAVLLVLSFPTFSQPWCAWVALVPWLLLLRSCSARAALRWSWLIGLMFFLGSMEWFVRLSAIAGPLTLVGWVALCAYLALYFGLFGWVVARGGREMWWAPWRWLVVPMVWVALEYLRSHVLSGLGWNLLAYGQTPYRPLIQCADLTGAWGISFLVVLVNAALARLLMPGVLRARAIFGVAGAVLCLLAACGYGDWRVAHLSASAAVRVAVVQGNIPQEHKWDAAYERAILEQYAALTRAAAETNPDLIVWPETATPGYVGIDEDLTQTVLRLAREVRRPLLIGSPTATIQPSGAQYHNSAILIEPTGRLAAQYHKVHLVPLGEFVPFERYAPWLRSLLPPIGDFTAGQEYTVFETPMRNAEFGMRNGHPASRIPHPALKFSALICFEDIFPSLARHFVQQGAQLLLVMTNDAWFGPSAAAYQHAQASTLRAVELRVPVARAANTGWSGCIDATGRWTGAVRDATGRELFVAGTHTCELPLGYGATLYQRWGDWFAVLCLALPLAIFFLPRTLRRI